MTVLQTDGLSHSEIHGSKVICTYPWLIAAYHVLHRLSEPRHPPYALVYFLSINKGSQSELLQAFKTFCLAHTLLSSEIINLKLMISKFELSLLYSLLVYQYVKDRYASLKALNDNG